MPITVYLEVGQKRTFAGAIDWPGWCRGGPDEEAAIAALMAYAHRYGSAIAASGGFEQPRDRTELEIVERLTGNATTDFGAPGIAPVADQRPLDAAELERQVHFLEACWAAFDRTVAAAAGVELRKGPRGGGRDLAKIGAHVLDAERAYLGGLGAKAAPAGGAQEGAIATHREQVTETLRARALDLPVPRSNNARTRWSPRYFVRRSAWHLLDHTWEIEDRSEGRVAG